MLSVSRPNFFPGQLIDYKDFNRLSEQADRTISMLFEHLYCEGGIVVDAFEEFKVTPMGGLSVRLSPGIALLPNGQVVVLEAERVIDLSQYAEGKSTRTVVVAIRNLVRGMDKYRDEDDATITGYKTEVFEPEITTSTRKAASEALELFRVTMPPGATSLRQTQPNEEWETKLVVRGEKREGLIDLRYRRRIVPHTYSPVGVDSLISLRRALYSLEDTHRKLVKIFLVEDTFDTAQYLSQLHAELLTVPFQPLKVSFLLSEYSKKLSLYLEHLSRRLGRQQSNLDKTTLLNAIEVLESLRCKEVLPRELNLDELNVVSQMLEAVLKFAEEKYNLLNAIEEGLLDMRTRFMAVDPRISLGGHVLERVDSVRVGDNDKYQIKADRVHTRSVSAAFKNGDRLSLKGAFIKHGVITVEANIPNPDRPAIIVQRQYVRRGGAQVHYEVNGKHLVTEQGSDSSMENNWMNYGLVVPAENLVANENRLKIRVEKSDLDFGFFDLAVYQPVSEKAVQK